MPSEHYHYSLAPAMAMSISKTRSKLIDSLVETSKCMRLNGFSSNGRTFHTCFCIKHNSGKVLAVGWNDYGRKIGNSLRSFGAFNYYDPNKHPDSTYDPSIHAEASVILKLDRMDNSDCDFVNVRIDRNGHVATSRPCECCFRMLSTFGYKRLFWHEYGHWQCVKPNTLRTND